LLLLLHLSLQRQMPLLLLLVLLLGIQLSGPLQQCLHHSRVAGKVWGTGL
jgi:hypothetical protein